MLELVKRCVEDFRRARIMEDFTCGLKNDENRMQIFDIFRKEVKTLQLLFESLLV